MDFDDKTLLLVVYLSLAFLAVWSEGKSVALKDHTNMEALLDEYNCKGLYGETAEETTELLEQCRILMENEFMQLSKKHLQNATTQDLENAIREFELKSGNSYPNINKRSVTGNAGCPVMNKVYLATHSSTGSRSLSPYTHTGDFNSNRFPRHRFQHTCLCNGCINQRTGEEDLTLSSISLIVTVKTFYRNKGKWKVFKDRVRAGCTCVVPLG